MLQIKVPVVPEMWDEEKEEFIPAKYKTLQLEHSLVSISKWESKWCKPFLSKNEKTAEETIDYVRCMTLTQNVDPQLYSHLTPKNIDEVMAYIDAPMTATTFSEDPTSKRNNRVITSEIIYHWMIALNIPQDYRKWHLNRLLTLIRVCSIENQPSKGKKMSQREIMNRNRALNEARRKKLNSKG